MTFTKSNPKRLVSYLGAAAALFAAALFFNYYFFRHETAEQLPELAPSYASPAPNLQASLPQTALSSPTPQISPKLTTTSAPIYSAQTKTLLATLGEIFASRNDNDPRLDRDFKNLTPEAKAALRAKYSELPSEDRNGRGTIVFLISRELRDPNDFSFLRSVLSEHPCLSLANCEREFKPAQGSDEHQNMGVAITLQYPQRVALHGIEQLLTSTSEPLPTPASREEALRLLQVAKESPIPDIRRVAMEIEAKLKR